MFNLYYGNDSARLADQLGARLTVRAQNNPLTPALVLVPQAGLRRWLQVHLAERLGVIANLDFRAPAQFAWDLLRAARPELSRQSPFEPEVLRWHLYALLGEPMNAPALATLRDYLQRDGDPLRRYALAGELARVFERLEGYRRGRLLQWELGTEPNDWQAELWRRLVRRLGNDYRAARLDAWLREYAGDNTPPGLPVRISAFACANISPDVLRMLGIAARHCEVDFYWPTPSREYWGDVPRSRRLFRKLEAEGIADNPLLGSLGGAGAEFAELLFGYDEVCPDVEADLSVSPSRNTLLGRVRADILERRAPAAETRDAALDDSLQFHACHSPLREVQTLHDRLLAMFEDKHFDPPLRPRDIAVMMPDVAAYRSFIDATFGGFADDDLRCIPYSIGDVGAASAHPAAQLFLRLLDAPTSRWEASELLEVLAVPGVLRRLDLDADDLAQLTRQVRDAGVRWGENEHARAHCGDYREFSWAFGLDRLLAGFACGDDEDTLIASVAPMAGVEGAQFARLDALLALLSVWRRARELATRSLSATDWQHQLNALFDALYAPTAGNVSETRALEHVRVALTSLMEATQAAQLDQPLPWSDVRAYLRERLTDADPRQHLFGGGVTFCGMVPLRVVPFRVICLLGMDEASFPRREGSALDPLLADRRVGRGEHGDRNVRADDRLLFLQLIAAARDTLYISWVGRDAQTNKPLPPSTVVSELMDTLRDAYLSPASESDWQQRLPRVQPLHPFDAKLFDPQNIETQSFHREWLPAARPSTRIAELPPFVRGKLAAADDATDDDASAAREWKLDELKRFFRNPARGFLEQALGLHLPRALDDALDVEPLAPKDGLTRWKLTRALLEPASGDVENVLATVRACGALPPGAFGEEALREATAPAEALRAQVFAFTAGTVAESEQTVTAVLQDGTRITGTLTDRYPRGLLRVRPGIPDGRQVLDAWLDTLLAAACGVDGKTVLVALDGNDAASLFELPQPTQTQACDALQTLLALHREGLRAPLPFFVRTSWEHALHCMKPPAKDGPDRPIDLSTFIKAAEKDDNGFGGANELADAAVQTAWRGIDPSGRADPELARRLHGTALAVFAQPARAWQERS